MKVLFVSYCNEGGGAAKAINNIYQSFRNNIRFKFIVVQNVVKNFVFAIRIGKVAFSYRNIY
jgi:hypothetical protein